MIEFLGALIVFFKGLFGTSEDKEMEKFVNKLQAVLLHIAIEDSKLSEDTKAIVYKVIQKKLDAANDYIDLAKSLLDDMERYLKIGTEKTVARFYKLKYCIPLIGAKYAVSVSKGSETLVTYKTMKQRELELGFISDKYNLNCDRIIEYSPYVKKFKPKHIFKQRRRYKYKTIRTKLCIAAS